MGMYRNRMPDREVSAEMTKADYWEVQADMWHQNYKEAADEIVQMREALREIYEVYAGSEGIPQPMTAAEGYLLSLLMEVVRIAQKALKEKE
jgi:hypothetical protein